MFRLKIALIVLGGFLVWFGFKEFRVSSGTSSEPEVVDLAAFEKGEQPDNSCIQIQAHSAIYSASVYEYEASSYSSNDPGPSAKVNHTYYPIISPSHPFNVRWDELAEKYGSFDDVPETEELPDLDTFVVLVKTERFKTVGAIPDNVVDESSVSGLLVNRISGLDNEEKDLVRQNFPTVDPDKLLILEEGRKPSSLFKSLGMLGGGLLLCVLGLGWLAVGAMGSQ